MDALLLHHLAVPCVAQEKDIDRTPFVGHDIYYLNPDAYVRYEPDGATITPPMLYSSFLFVDQECAQLLRQREFCLQGVPKYIVALLLENKVILLEHPGIAEFRESSVYVDGLPTQVLLDVTSYCNCRCDACYHLADLHNHVPSLEEVTTRIEKLKSLGLMLFEITGGEPFSRPDLHEILECIRRFKLHFYVVTNGEYLQSSSRNLLDALKQGLGVAVSLDGVGETHDRIRRRKGLYDKILQGLEVVCAEGIPVYLISTLSQQSLDSVPAMIEVAERFNTTIHFRPTIQTGGALMNSLPPVDLLPHIGQFLNHPNVRNGLLNTKKVFPRSKFYGCGIRKRISVDSRGNLYPCVMDRSRYKTDILGYTQNTLVEALASETVSMLNGNDICKECRYNSKEIRCAGFCRFSGSYRSNKGKNTYD